MNAYDRLDWDSDFFGFEVARINAPELDEVELRTALETLEAKRFALAYWAAADRATTPPLAARLGGFLADRKTTYAIDLGALDVNALEPTPDIERYGALRACPELESLALESGAMSRFRVDPKFPKGTFEALYKQWIHKSAAGTLADAILVWRNPAGKIAGMVTLGRKNRRADIGLIAVDAAARGATSAAVSSRRPTAPSSVTVSPRARS